MMDMYYYEPETGNKFRSLRSIERYINGEEYAPQSRSRTLLRNNFEHPRYSKMIVYGGQLMRLDCEDSNQGQLAIVASPNTSLTPENAIPDGWVIEQVPRRNSAQTDKYYYEPGTGRKFRSQAGVLRHLTELREDMPLSAALEEIKENKPLSKVFKLGHHGKNSISRKKKIAKRDTQSSSFANPPKKIKWVLTSPQGDAWKPFIFETLVPDSVEQQWDQRFKSSMGDEDHNQPCCSSPS
ncbi:hypothetical protein M9H77_15941 [Catharanthus roseus]|uniref:Uncharacterized protein n=1 Tax=Catharanthus roseus TaxID=4058 RepID=A0ACC0AYJ9_CATRO|nr:hypothetical protein M9H77_15941 [Catharanthus roseus]